MQAVKKSVSILASVLFLAFSAAQSQAARFMIDPAHSSVEFKVRHMMIAKVSGKFDRFSGEFNYDAGNPQSWTANAVIESGSINTGNADRDNHLRNEDFFDVPKHPALTFRSTSVTDVKDGKGKLNGLLTMRGVEKPVTLDLEVGGVVNDPWGNTKAGFTATGKIARKDFGMTWNKTLDAGGVALGEEVEIILQIEGTQDKPAAPAATDKKGKKKK